MTNEERWKEFIKQLRAYIEEHHLGPSKHTTLHNQSLLYEKGKLGVEKSKQLEDVLELRDLTIHTGGRRKKTIDAYNGLHFMDLCP